MEEGALLSSEETEMLLFAHLWRETNTAHNLERSTSYGSGNNMQWECWTTPKDF